MKIIKVKRFIPGFKAITIAPFFVIVKKSEATASVLNHERIHWEQQKRDWYIGFYLWYLFEWVFRGFKYENISYEVEAKKNRYNVNYHPQGFIKGNPDKVLHYVTGFGVVRFTTMVGVILLLLCGGSQPWVKWWIPFWFLALCTGAAAKEIFRDGLLGKGKREWNDFGASVLGAIHGMCGIPKRY